MIHMSSLQVVKNWTVFNKIRLSTDIIFETQKLLKISSLIMTFMTLLSCVSYWDCFSADCCVFNSHCEKMSGVLREFKHMTSMCHTFCGTSHPSSSRTVYSQNASSYWRNHTSWHFNHRARYMVSTKPDIRWRVHGAIAEPAWCECAIMWVCGLAAAYTVNMSHSTSSSWTVLSPCSTVQHRQIIPARVDVTEGNESSATVTTQVSE